MTLHHIGYIVKTIEEGILSFEPFMKGQEAVSQVYDIKDQKVKVCFLNIGSDTLVELVEPSEENISLNKLRKKGSAFYHLGFTVEDLQSEISRLEESEYREVNRFSSPAFNGRECCFLLNPEMQLIELIQGESES